MRIIAGRLGGQNFQSPRGNRTHPMSDKVRGALFNVLGDISGLTLLDTFAGSGAISFEAVSRGAQHVTAIDNDRQAQQAIETNQRELKLEDNVQLVKASAAAWLSTTDQYFDIVICDPPYDDIQENLLKRVASRSKPHGLVVLSLPPHQQNVLEDKEFRVLSQKDYGDATLWFYRRDSFLK